jgi:exonuclease III
VANWIKKEDPTICCLQETHLIDRNKPWLRVKGLKKIYQANGPWKGARLAILLSDKVDFKLTTVKEDKEVHFILLKGVIYQKEISTTNSYVSTPNFIKHTLKNLKAHIDSNRVVVGDFNIPLSQIKRSSRQKMNEEILDLNDTIEQMDQTDVYRIFHLATA